MNEEKKQKSKFNYWYLLLIIPFLTSLWPGIYNFDAPRLFGFPFFYWYQMAMVVVSAILTGIVYVKTKSE